MTDKLKNFDVVFDVQMPGASRKAGYTITVQADNRSDALVIAEGKWAEITGNYDVRVNIAGKTPAKEG